MSNYDDAPQDPSPAKVPPIVYNGRKYFRNARGYWCSGGPPRPGPLHRHVWEDAHGQIPEGYHIHHRDQNKSNNALDNLELLEGRRHLSLHKKGQKHVGLRGESCPVVKLTEAQVIEIRATYVKGRNGGQRALAEKYGVDQSTISNAISGRNWGHLEGGGIRPFASHCAQGHEYSAATVKMLNSGARRCRICFNAVRRAYRAKKRAEKRALRSYN